MEKLHESFIDPTAECMWFYYRNFSFSTVAVLIITRTTVPLFVLTYSRLLSHWCIQYSSSTYYYLYHCPTVCTYLLQTSLSLVHLQGYAGLIFSDWSGFSMYSATENFHTLFNIKLQHYLSNITRASLRPFCESYYYCQPFLVM